MNKDIYPCMSLPLHLFLIEQGLKPIDQMLIPDTKKYKWFYKKNSELDKCLTIWSNRRR